MIARFSLGRDITTHAWSSAGALAETPLRLCMRHTPVVFLVHSTLAGCGPDGHGDAAPRLTPRGALGQVQDEARH